MILTTMGIVQYIRAGDLGELANAFNVLVWGPEDKPLDLLAVVLVGNGQVRIDGIKVNKVPGVRLAGRRVSRRAGLRTSFTVAASEPVPAVLTPKE